MVYFASYSDRANAVSSVKVIGGRKLSLSNVGGENGNIAFVRNIDYKCKEGDLKKQFTNVKSVELNKGKNGEFSGYV